MSESFAHNIAKFIPDYPLATNKKFSYEIAKRKEFQDLKLEPSEPVSEEQGIPLLSQELQARFFSPETDYRAGLLFHEMGTGKSCTSSLIIENFKSILVGGRPRKPALVLVPNEDLARSYRAQIAFQCTQAGTYLPQFTEAERRRIEESITVEMSELKYERRLRVAIAQTYELATYDTFLFRTTHAGGKTKIEPRLSRDPEKLREKFSNRIIIIDEAHNLRIQPVKKKKQTAIQRILEEEPGTSVEIYNEMHRFLHTVENCRIILLSGTPIWDQVYEIASVMNLILPLSEQLPTKTQFTREFFDDDGTLIPEKAAELRTRFRGRVSYLRAMTTTAKRDEIGVRKPWLKYMIVYPSAMSEFQYDYAKESLEKIEKITVTYTSKTGKVVKREREVKGGAVRLLARDAANFVFPVLGRKGDKIRVVEGTYGKKGFNANIKASDDKKRYTYKDPDIRREIRENLRMFSSKFTAIIEMIKARPNELIFIYDEFVASGGGGVINLALVLQEHNFVWAKTAKDISQPHPTQKKRFAVISSNIATTHKPKGIENLIESFNMPDNKYGERCQIIIGSKKIALGLTLKNVRQVHIVMPHWNLPAISQAVARTYRVGSHNALPEEERYINIYRHVSVKEYDKDEDLKEYDMGKGFPKDVGFSNTQTIDTVIYGMAETKQHYNAQIYRLLKEISWDCPLVYARNVLRTDKNKSEQCDFIECNYRCDNYPQRYIDKSQKVWSYFIPQEEILKDSYNLFYSAKDLSNMVERIQKLFGIYFSLRFDMIGYLVNISTAEEHDLLLRALDYIINSRLQIKDRYGFGNYLKEQGNIYFLDSTISSYSNYPESTYTASPLVTERISLEDIAEVSQLTEDKALVQKFCKSPSKRAELLSEMHYRTLILLLEKIQELRVKDEKKQTRREKEALAEIMKRLGRNLVTMPDGSVIHNMYASEYTGLGYSVAVQELKPTGLMRVFSPTTKTWDYVENKEQEEKYITRIKQIQKAQKEVTWETIPIDTYGFRDKDGKFKIREKAAPGKRQTKGSVCIEASWSLARLYALLNKLNYIPETEAYQTEPRSKLIDTIKAQPALRVFTENIEKRSTDELRGILALNTLKKEEICDDIEEWFKENNAFFDYRV